MSLVKIKTSTFRQISLAAGVGGLFAAALFFYREQIVGGFLLAFLGLSVIAAAETNIDFSAELSMRSFGKLLMRRSCVSTFGKVCDIMSYVCLAAAGLAWLAQR